MASKSDYYDILGVNKGATDAEIKTAYRKQAVEWHPDKHQGSDKEAAEKRFKEINEAYQILSNKEKRSAYDNFGHSAFSPGGAPPGAGGFGGQNPFGGGGGWKVHVGGSGFQGHDFGDPFDIFEQFFGGRGGGNPFARGQSLPRYSITIEFMEAINGVSKEVSIGGKKRTIKIPAGVDEGSRIKFDDFILSVNIKPHDIFERDGADIFVKLDIPYSLAVLGGKLEVPTIDGSLKVKIRKGTKSGTMMRLKNKGARLLRGTGFGDQYVRLHVEVPERVSKSQKRLFEEMRKEGL